jgi:hypothetical protein
MLCGFCLSFSFILHNKIKPFRPVERNQFEPKKKKKIFWRPVAEINYFLLTTDGDELEKVP